MKLITRSHVFWLIVGCFLFLGSVHSAAASMVFGTVYDNRRNALAQVDVELLDQYHGLSQHTTTDGIGRYTFDGLTDGDWYVRVLPFRYDFDEETQPVTIYTITQVSNKPGYEAKILDFVLAPRKGTLAYAQAEVIFAQDIPPEAKKAFEAGVRSLKKAKPDEAIISLQEAVKIFPDYFLANHYLGSIFIDKKDFEHAAPPLMKATQINEKSGVTLYLLGFALNKLNYNKAAIVALKAAAVIIPASPAVFKALGSAELMERQYPDAEKSLLTAKKLQKSENPELYKELAVLYGETRQFEKGAQSLEQMLKVGNYSNEDTAKIREQIQRWKELAAKSPAKT